MWYRSTVGAGEGSNGKEKRQKALQIGKSEREMKRRIVIFENFEFGKAGISVRIYLDFGEWCIGVSKSPSPGKDDPLGQYSTWAISILPLTICIHSRRDR